MLRKILFQQALIKEYFIYRSLEIQKFGVRFSSLSAGSCDPAYKKRFFSKEYVFRLQGAVDKRGGDTFGRCVINLIKGLITTVNP